MHNLKILQGDCREVLKTLPEASVHCCVTSPPYWGLRDYGTPGQLGLEKTPQEYVVNMLAVFREVRRVLRDDGTLWLNLGDSYTSGGRKERDPGQSKIHPAYEGEAFEDGLRPGTPPGLKPKDLVGIPWRVAFALQEDGWYLRSDIIWHKPNPMPESVTDRPTKAHEYLFLLSKSERYHYDAEAIQEPALNTPGGRLNGNTKHCEDWPKGSAAEGRGLDKGGLREFRNRRSVWTVATSPYTEAHFATYPPDLIKPCIMAGCPVGGTVLDPFGGSGTTGMVALELGRGAVLIELNPDYMKLAEHRCNVTPGLALA